MKVVIIGSGNVATVLGRLIKNANHDIVQVFSRDIVHANLLANELRCEATDSAAQITKTAGLYLFALSDTALHDLGNTFHFGDKLVVHTAGSVSKDVFKNVSLHYGVLYPLQTLRKEIKVMSEIPLLADGNSDETLAAVVEFAKTISPVVYETTDEQRYKLHVAAVVVNNFTNHLFALAADYCKEEEVDFSMLLPLIDETVQRIHQYPLNEMQTGPAIRNDTITLDKHFKWLSNYPKLKYIYVKLTESIIGR